MTERAADSSLHAVQEQAPNRVDSGFDPAEAFDFLEEVTADWPARERDRLDVVVLRALARLSLKEADSARVGFPAVEVVQMVGEILCRPWSSQDDKDRMADDVRKQWKRLRATWDRKRLGIAQRFHDRGFGHMPELFREEGGGARHTSKYGIRWIALDAPPTPERLAEVSDPAPSETTLKYVCEDITDAGLLARIFARGYELSRWRLWLMITLVVLVLALGYVLFVIAIFGITRWSRVGTSVVLEYVGGLAVYVLAVWVCIGPIFRVLSRRVVSAPMWMQDVDDSRLLEHHRAPARTIKAVRYTSSCPICGGPVAATGGGIEFWGRIVGRCKESPTEHVFSFDHVTRRGKSLR